MTQSTQNLTEPKYKAASIAFVVINSISVIQGILAMFMALNMPTSALGITDGDAVMQKSLFSLYALTYLATSTYALVIGCLVLARRAPGFWMSGAIVSIAAGLLGMIMFLFHLPVAIWLIIAIKRLRQQPTTGITNVEQVVPPNGP